MLRRSLSGLNHARLRLWLLVFFFALAIPTAALLRQTYSQLKWEALHQHRVLAEELAGRIDASINRLVQREEARGFTDYRFLVVAGDPGAGLVQRSVLAAWPVNSDIPGLIGYFQVDSDGAFSSPLLPGTGDAADRYGIGPTELQQREALTARVQGILSDNRLVSEYKAGVSAGGLKLRTDAVAADDRERDLPESASHPAPAAAPPAEEQIAGQAVFDQLGKTAVPRQKSNALSTPGSLGRVEDLKLDERFEAQSDALRQQAPAARTEAVEEKRAARKEYSALAEAEWSASKTVPPRVNTFESALDPFEFSLLDSGHFVLFRKVWRDGQRYIQGLVIEAQPWLHAVIETAFHDTVLSRMSDLIVAFRGDVLIAFSGNAERDYLSSAAQLSGTLLHRARLSAPLGDLQLIFTVTRLPAPPGATLVNWLAAILALVLCAGFYLMYRLGARQIELAHQQQDFVSAVSHELKTPLTSIRMYGEMLREGWAPEDKKKSYYEFIHDESERLSRLIGNVLQLARMTRNDLQLNVRRITAAELMDGIRSRVSSQIERSGFELSLACDPDAGPALLKVDSDAFTQIMINLVDNAIKFSARAEHKAIDISCRRLPDRQLQFAVRDFGPGISRDQLKKIFRLFYRPGNELTRETVGTGIGLALVQQLALAMHGKVDVVNQQPGAEFRVLFPVVESR